MNASSDFTNAVCAALITNISTISALSDSNNAWTQASLDLGNAWVNTTDSQLQVQLDAIDSTEDVGAMADDMDEWSINYWSMNGIMLYQSQIAKYWDESDANKSPIWNSMAGNYMSMIQATQQVNQSTADSNSKALASMIQSIPSGNESSLTQAGDAVRKSNTSSAQSQVSA